jgi:sugar transferase (PEP-CTERM/EpsH1 system associated)
MRILVLLPRFPYPPRRGDAVRAWTTLSGLAERHEVWLGCVDEKPPAPEHLQAVRRKLRGVAVYSSGSIARICCGMLRLLAGGSFTEGYFHNRKLLETLRRWSSQVKFDAVLTYSSAMAPAAEAACACRRVLDLNDVDSDKWSFYAQARSWPLRALYRLEARRVALLEARAVRAHDVCLVVNQREKHKLLTALPGTPCAVVHTGLELADYPEPDASSQPAEPVFGFVGSLHYSPNVDAVEWFGERVWPVILRLIPHARWWIVGRRPGRRVQRWSRRPGVMVAADVPDVRPYLSAMRVFVDPVGTELGVQTKLLMALAAGRPAVVRSATAAGLEYEEPAPFLVGDSPEEFAAAAVRLARDDRLWQQLSNRARATAAQFYGAARQVELIERYLAGRTESSARPTGRNKVPQVTA